MPSSSRDGVLGDLRAVNRWARGYLPYCTFVQLTFYRLFFIIVNYQIVFSDPPRTDPLNSPVKIIMRQRIGYFANFPLILLAGEQK
jgi:hypothetical protein